MKHQTKGIAGPRRRSGERPLDELDIRILRALADQPRLSTASLARAVSLSAPAVRDRLRRLEESGVIRGYRLDLDPAAVGLAVSAWVRVRPGPGQLSKIAALAAELPQVSECHRISGEDCFLMRVHVASIEDLEPLLDRFLLFGQTTSSLVVSSPVPPRAVVPSVDASVDGTRP